MTAVAKYIQKTWRGMRGRAKARAAYLAIEHARMRLEQAERHEMRRAEADCRERWAAIERVVQMRLEQERALRLYQSFAGVPKERTLCIIKPDAVRAGHTRAILKRAEEDGFDVLMKKRVTMQPFQFDTLYGHFLHRPFWHKLRDFMCSGPLVAVVLQREEAIERWREVIGYASPSDARRDQVRTRRSSQSMR